MVKGLGSARLAGVDVARALALIGMMSVHIFPEFTADGSLHPSYAVAAGRSAALFAVLAGVGLALSTGARQPPSSTDLRAARAGVLTRGVLLVLLGLLLGLVDSPPLVILAYYGVLFLFALPFLGLRARSLGWLTVVAALCTPVLSHLLRLHIGGPTVIDEPVGGDLFVELALTGTYPALTWLTYALAGLTVGRLPLRSPRVALGIAAVGGAIAVAAKLGSRWLLSAVGGADSLVGTTPAGTPANVGDALEAGMFGTTPTRTWDWLVISAPHTGTTLDLLHTTGTSMLVLALCLLATRAVRGLLVPLACVGSMTLTLYSLHVLVLSTSSPFARSDPTKLCLVHVAVAALLATWWRLTVGRGPLEGISSAVDRAVRRATGRRQPTAVQGSS